MTDRHLTDSQHDPSDDRNGRIYLRFAGAGLELAGFVLLFAFMGHWVDRLIGWQQPWSMVVGALLGLSGGLYRLHRLLNSN